MDKIDILENKIRAVAGQLLDLKEENKKLHSNVKFLESENKKSGELIKENGYLKEEKRQLATRVEKVLKKIGALKV